MLSGCVFFLLVTQLAWADGDICTIRPDLCDEPVRKPAAAPARPRCFPAKADQRLNRNHLTLCRVNPTLNARPASGATANPLPRPTSARAPVGGRVGEARAGSSAPNSRAPASTAPPANDLPTTFEAYLRMNGSNSSLHRHGIEQNAFVDISKPAAIILPTIDGVTSDSGNGTSAASVTPGAAGAAGGVGAGANGGGSAAGGGGGSSGGQPPNAPGSGAR